MVWMASLLIAAISGPYSGYAQTISYTPGPANLDTAKFAHIYFLRDGKDEFPDNWLGVMMNNDTALCVKAAMDHIYRVNTIYKGSIRFKSAIKGTIKEIFLDLEPGKHYFVEVRPVRQTDNRILPVLEVLDPAAAIMRIRAYPGLLQERYCPLPLSNPADDYRENSWKDTVAWGASKASGFYFKPLPSWEIIRRSPANTAFAFRNEMISKTYSEVGGIIHEMKGKRTENEFENYCKKEFLASTIDPQKDSLLFWEIKPIERAEGVQFARMLNVELQNRNLLLSKDRNLHIRSSFVIFYWTDERGKGYTSCIFDTERGLAEEVHPMKDIEDRIQWSWRSFRVATYNR
jgi:hypothetical protein